jgi:hypothetical protein
MKKNKNAPTCFNKTNHSSKISNGGSAVGFSHFFINAD